MKIFVYKILVVNVIFFITNQMITMMLGANTLCLEICEDDKTLFVDKHRSELYYALSYIKEHLPRTIVNLVLGLSK